MTDTAAQTVFIVDDDVAVRDSIAELVGSVGLKSEGYESGSAFLQGYRSERLGCLVLDVRMAEMSGLAVQQRLNAQGARLPVVMLTAHGDVAMAVQAMKAGAVDFLQKPYRDQALLDSINAALSADAAVRQASATAEGFHQCLAALTVREREVIDLLLAGRTSRAIAETLGISPRTAEVHRGNILRKIGVGTAKELIDLAAVEGIAAAPDSGPPGS